MNGRTARSALGAFLIATFAIACTAAEPEPTPTTEPSSAINDAASDTALRTLVERLLTYPSVPSAEPAQVLPQELPPGFDIRLPEGTQVIGSVVRQVGQTQVVLDVSGEPEEVMGLFEESLAASGWRAQEWIHRAGGGFMSGGLPGGAYRIFCDDARQRYLALLTAPPEQGKPVDVRLDITAGDELYPPAKETKEGCPA